MNAEYHRRQQTWRMLKPKMEARPEEVSPSQPALPLALANSSAASEWSLAMMDPVALAHGVRELASPLSE